jgi:hypothetical protein
MEGDRVALAPVLAAPMAIPAAEILVAGAAVWAAAAIAQDRDGMARALQSTARDLQGLFSWSPGQVQLAAGYLNKELPRLFSQANFDPFALKELVRQLPEQLAQHVSFSSIRSRTSMPPAHRAGPDAARSPSVSRQQQVKEFEALGRAVLKQDNAQIAQLAGARRQTENAAEIRRYQNSAIADRNARYAATSARGAIDAATYTPMISGLGPEFGGPYVGVSSSGNSLPERVIRGAANAVVSAVTEPVLQVRDIALAGFSVTYNELIRKHGEAMWLPEMRSGVADAYAGGASQTRLLLQSNFVTGTGVLSFDATTAAMQGRWGDVAEMAGGVAGGFAVGKVVQRYGGYGIAFEDIGASGPGALQRGAINLRLYDDATRERILENFRLGNEFEKGVLNASGAEKNYSRLYGTGDLAGEYAVPDARRGSRILEIKDERALARDQQFQIYEQSNNPIDLVVTKLCESIVSSRTGRSDGGRTKPPDRGVSAICAAPPGPVASAAPWFAALSWPPPA